MEKIKKIISERFINKCRNRNFPYERYMDHNHCIFIHIPKVAGTSIFHALGKNKGGRNHLPWYVYHAADKYKFRKYFKFAFVRNPWDRIYSSYSYFLNGGNQQGDVLLSKTIKKYQSFDHFIVDGLGSGAFRNNLLFLPQSEFIIGSQGNVVLDFLGYYERLEEDFDTLMSVMKISGNLLHLNKSSKQKRYKEAYSTQESIKIVEQIYRQDISTFNYKF